ncbi:MAG: hypothetical protein JWR54_89 [Mucilaginibacter sp.]|nr:hypothetical protein [Mucilaginibacter sp.]
MALLNNTDVDTRDRELVLTRIFDAPRELVYKVWTDPEHVSKWWGPKVFSNPVCQIDLRPGGAYLYVMRSPEGMEFPVRGKFIEIVANERLVYSDDMFEQQDLWKQMLGKSVSNVDFSTLQSIITVTFEGHGNKTKLTLITRFVSNEVRDAMLKMQMAEGWTESLEKFADELTKA